MLLDLNYKELEDFVVLSGFAKFRARQIFEALYQGKTLEESNLPKEIKEAFKETPAKIIKILTSKDGTKKFVIEFPDGEIVECVLLKYSYGNTLCVSTQVGCRMGCKFCASGLNGLIRNLSAGEILSQVILINKEENGGIKTRQITNIVLMGSGEPLDNFINVTKFIKLVSDINGFNISLRNISLSTCGIVPKIIELADNGPHITLTISLHNSNQEDRDKIMNISKAYKIEEVIDAARYYFKKTKRRVIFEYALIKGINDSETNIKELRNLLKGFSYHVNIIPLNDVKEQSLIGTSRKEAYVFCNKLNEVGISATVRRTMGEDIEGACGQLRNKIIEDKKS